MKTRPVIQTPKDIRFEIGFALGQAGAQLFIDCHSKSPEKREKAIEALTERVAARFETLTVIRNVPDRSGPLFG